MSNKYSVLEPNDTPHLVIINDELGIRYLTKYELEQIAFILNLLKDKKELLNELDKIIDKLKIG